MKEYAFNGLSLVQERFSGIHRNTLELLKELDNKCRKGEIKIVIPNNSKLDHSFSNIEIVTYGLNPYSTNNRLLFKLVMFLWRHFFYKMATKQYIRVDSLLLHPSCGCDVVFVYDCIPEKFPKLYNKSLKLKKNRLDTLRRQKSALRKCKIVITDSESAKKDIISYYKLNNNNVYVVPCAWQHFNRIIPDDTIIEKLSLTDNSYYFSLGSQFEHKNIKWIISAAEQNPNYIFVITGKRITSYEFNNLDNIIFTGYLSDGEIKSLMKHAKAFIQPSLYEGFGIPPLEAMSVGTNCIVSNCSSLPEVYGDSVWYIDPYSYNGIDLDAIESAPKESNEVILNKYSWALSAEKLLKILRTM